MRSILMVTCRGEFLALVLILGLLAACVQGPASDQIPPGEESASPQAPVESPVSLPTETTVAATAAPTIGAATATPDATATGTSSPEGTEPSGGEGLVLAPENALQIQAVGDIRLGEARLFAWRPDSQSLVVATQSNIIVYNLNPLTETGRIDAPAAIMLVVSPDGNTVAWVGEDNALRLATIPTGSDARMLSQYTASPTSLAFSPDGSILAVSTSQNTIELWNLVQGQSLQTWTLPSVMTELSFSPDGTLLAAVEQSGFTVHMYSLPGGEEQRSLSWTEHASPVLYSVQFTPDWKTLAWVARGTVQLMDVATGNLGPSLGHEDFVSAIALPPESNLLASAAAGMVGENFVPAVYLWDIATGEQVHVLPQEQPVTSVKFSPDGRSLAILTFDNVLRFWEVPN